MDIDKKSLGNRHYENKKKGGKENRWNKRSHNLWHDKYRDCRKKRGSALASSTSKSY